MPASKRHLTPEKTAKLVADWPSSWAGDEEDEPVGRGLVVVLQPFISDLIEQDLSSATIRRHLDHLWLIGGEIIRDVNDDPALRRKQPRQLLLDAIYDGHAPLARDLTEQEQASVDATARKLLKFLAPPKLTLP